MLLHNKNAVIYGAGGPVGGAVAGAFAREGAKVFLTGDTSPPIDALAKEIIEAGGLAEAAQVDALDAQAVEKHMAPAIASNPGHAAYFYCSDNADLDSICAFQEYSSVEASEDFSRTSSYAAYLKDVEPLLADPPQVTALTPMWSKGA